RDGVLRRGRRGLRDGGEPRVKRGSFAERGLEAPLRPGPPAGAVSRVEEESPESHERGSERVRLDAARQGGQLEGLSPLREELLERRVAGDPRDLDPRPRDGPERLQAL